MNHDESRFYSYLNEGMPDWEDAGTFPMAWRGARLFATDDDIIDEQLRMVGEDCTFLLERAHVVNLDYEQYKVLPDVWEDLVQYDPDPHLPFDVIYVSIGEQENPDDEWLAGVLLATNQEELAIVPFFRGHGMGWATPSTLLDLKGRGYTDLIALMLSSSDALNKRSGATLQVDPISTLMEETRSTQYRLLMGSMKVLRFLEAANVDIEQNNRISRQVRRNAQRRGKRISEVVTVRSPRRPTRALTKGDNTREFSHRFEVRGHYKHYGPNTQLFKATERDKPNKILDHPTRGKVVRIWCPDFVKGPDDQPLIPKARRWNVAGA